MYPHFYHLQHFHQAVTSSSFSETFWAEFAASLIITVLGATLIPKYLDWRKRPKLEFRNRTSRTNHCVLTVSQDDKWEGSFQLAIRNEGPTTQRDIYWHILIPNELEVTLTPFDAREPTPGYEILRNSRIAYKHFSGEEKRSIFSRTGLTFPYEMKLKTPTNRRQIHKIYYYFRAEFGTSPARAEKYHEIERALGRNADDAFKPEYLSELVIEPEQ